MSSKMRRALRRLARFVLRFSVVNTTQGLNWDSVLGGVD